MKTRWSITAEICLIYTGAMLLLMLYYRWTRLDIPFTVLTLLACLIYVVLATVPVLICLPQKKQPDFLGFSLEQLGRQLIIALALPAALLFIYLILPTVLGVPLSLLLGRSRYSAQQLYISIMYKMLFVAFSEEILFRGYLLNRLRDLFRLPVFPVIISSILFGLFHYPVNRNIPQLIIASVTGAVFAVVALRWKKSLLALCLAHGIYDCALDILRFLLL